MNWTSVGLRVAASSFRRGAVACTGTEFCKLAITETKAFSRWLVEELEERIPGFRSTLEAARHRLPQQLRPTLDRRHRYRRQKAASVDGEMVDAYYFCVGGASGQFASIARPIGYRCPASDVPAASSGCFKLIWNFGDATKISVSFLRATPTRPCAIFSQGRK